MATPSYETVTAMIAPALFLTATGSLIISTATRMGRIVDCIRVLVELCHRMGRGDEAFDFPEVRRRHALDELRHLQDRSDRAMAAVTMLYMAFGSFSATSMVIAIDSVVGHRIVALPALFAATGVVLLLIACVNLVIEARTALRSNDMEVRFFHKFEGLREAAGATTPDAGQLWSSARRLLSEFRLPIAPESRRGGRPGSGPARWLATEHR
jgi:hypothetical protein